MDCLTCRADAAVLAGQSDAATFNGGAATRLDDIPVRSQRHVTKSRIARESGIAVLALESHDCHIPRQGLIIQESADSGDVDIPLAGGNSVKLDIVRHDSLTLSILSSNLADGSNMYVTNIVLRREVHDLALQGRVIVLEDAARRGVHSQRSRIVGVGHISRQINAAAVGIGAGDIDTARRVANQPDGNGLGGAYGVTVSFEGLGAFRPTGIVVSEPAEESRLFEPTLRLGLPML